MKAFGHTKTLFIQGGKYKWSYKNDCCVSCRNVKNPHKGNGLCIACFDKKRAEKRKGALKKQQAKNYWKNRILKVLGTPVDIRKKGGQKPTGFDEVKYKKQWYQKNREVILLKEKARKMKAIGLPCLSMWINNKEYFFPFEGLEKPNTTMQASGDFNQKWYDWKEKERQFELLKNWYLKNKKSL